MGPLLRFFTNDAAVVELGSNFLRILAPSYFTFVFIEIFPERYGARGSAAAHADYLLRRLRPADSVGAHRRALLAHYGDGGAELSVTWAATALVFIIYYARMKWLDRCVQRSGAVVSD